MCESVCVWGGGFGGVLICAHMYVCLHEGVLNRYVTWGVSMSAFIST